VRKTLRRKDWIAHTHHPQCDVVVFFSDFMRKPRIDVDNKKSLPWITAVQKRSRPFSHVLSVVVYTTDLRRLVSLVTHVGYSSDSRLFFNRKFTAFDTCILQYCKTRIPIGP